ncbi:hypothetical protein CPB84DRAFT_1793778, partial [Gymnopilus junonius]
IISVLHANISSLPDLVDVLIPISHNVNFQQALKEKAVDHYIKVRSSHPIYYNHTCLNSNYSLDQIPLKDLDNFIEDAEKSRNLFLRIEKNVQNFQGKLTTTLYASAGAPANENFATLENAWREMENLRKVFYALEDRLSVVGRVWPIVRF